MKKQAVSLCMIVKNEESCLQDCLASVKDLVSEIIIVDTGSTDGTIRIAQSFGAKIFHYTWNDNFSDARNFSLAQASEPWILVLDADERLDSSSFAAIHELLKNEELDACFLNQLNYIMDSDALGWEPNINYIQTYPYVGYIKEPMIRLFKRAANLSFSGVIHEDILLTAKHRSLITNIPIHHLGKLMDPTRTDKENLYLKLTQNKYEQDSQNPQIIFELAKQNYVSGRWEPSLDLVKQLLTHPHYQSSAWILMAFIYFRQNNFPLVRDTLMELMKKEPLHPQIYIMMPLVLAHLKHQDLICQFIEVGKTVAKQYPAFFINASFALEDSHDCNQAINILKEFMELNAVLLTPEVASQCFRRISELYFKLRDYHSSLSNINMALHRLPNDAENIYQKSVILYYLGEYVQSQANINMLPDNIISESWKNKINNLRSVLNESQIFKNTKGVSHVLL